MNELCKLRYHSSGTPTRPSHQGSGPGRIFFRGGRIFISNPKKILPGLFWGFAAKINSAGHFLGGRREKKILPARQAPRARKKYPAGPPRRCRPQAVFSLTNGAGQKKPCPAAQPEWSAKKILPSSLPGPAREKKSCPAPRRGSSRNKNPAPLPARAASEK